ncbi:MAG: TonB-dependent receptor [Marinoscillum sp.]
MVLRRFLLLWMLCGLIDLGAQHKISGTVTFNSSPVPGATVQVKGTEVGTSTDVNGYFELSDLKGELTLITRSIGYKQQSIPLDVTSNRSIQIDLTENELGLDEVVVTGTMKPTMVSASPIKVEVITAKHLNTYIPAAASSIVDGIKLINGVQEVVACGVCFTNSISINGLPGPYTAVLIDGSPMFGNLASVYGLNGIPNMVIDRFEVIKGPNSTLYGSEAMAGVINVITKDPENQPAFSIDVMGTSHLETFGNIGVTSNTKKFKGFTGLNYAIISDFDDINDDGFGDMINLDRYSLFSKWSMKRASKKKFTIAGKLYYEDRRNGVEEFLEDRAYRSLRGNDSIYGESIYTYRGEVFGTYEFDLPENLKIDYSISQHFQDSYYGADHYLAQQTIGFANLIWNKQVEKHHLLAGLTNRLQVYDDNTVATQDDGGQNQWIPGLFVQDEFELTDDFTLLGGMRLDHYTSHGLIFSPRLSTKLKLGQWTTFRTNLGTGFRVVNLFTEDHAFVTGQREVVIEEALDPEESINGSFNLNHVFTLGASQGMFDLDAYYSYFHNKIIPDYDTPGFIYYANSDGYAVSKGIGLNWNQEFLFPLSYSLGANVQSVREFENVAGTEVSQDVEFAPKWSGVFNANYQMKKAKLTIAYSLRVTGSMALPEVYDLDASGEPVGTSRPQESEPFAFQNLQVSKEFDSRFSAYFGIQNLFNYLQEESPLVGYNDPNVPTGFSQYFDTSYAYAPIHGREFYIGVKWQID